MDAFIENISRFFSSETLAEIAKKPRTFLPVVMCRESKLNEYRIESSFLWHSKFTNDPFPATWDRRNKVEFSFAFINGGNFIRIGLSHGIENEGERGSYRHHYYAKSGGRLASWAQIDHVRTLPLEISSLQNVQELGDFIRNFIMGRKAYPFWGQEEDLGTNYELIFCEGRDVEKAYKEAKKAEKANKEWHEKAQKEYREAREAEEAKKKRRK